VRAPPCLRSAAEPRREEIRQTLPISAEHLLVVEQDSVEIEEDVHREVAEPRVDLKRCGNGEIAK